MPRFFCHYTSSWYSPLAVSLFSHAENEQTTNWDRETERPRKNGWEFYSLFKRTEQSFSYFYGERQNKYLVWFFFLIEKASG